MEFAAKIQTLLEKRVFRRTLVGNTGSSWLSSGLLALGTELWALTTPSHSTVLCTLVPSERGSRKFCGK